MNVPLFYHDKPIFGLDIGHSTLKCVQLVPTNNGHTVSGYGFTSFSERSIKDGVVVDPTDIAKAAYKLLTEQIIGGLTTNRIATAIPVAKTYTRIINVPQASRGQLEQAVRLEVEQYVPVPPDDLYIDYEVTYDNPDEPDTDLEVLMVAAPRAVVDSYIDLFDMLGLEVAMVETSLISSVRGVTNSLRSSTNSDSKKDTDSKKKKNDSTKDSNSKKDAKDKENEEPQSQGTLLMDMGAKSTDLSIFDSTIRVTGTIEKGGDTITKAISDSFKITERQAHTLKSRFGIRDSKHKAKIMTALKPTLEDLIREVRKMQRYYKSRSQSGGDIGTAVILGGGANLPGMAELIEKETKIKTTVCDPWQNISFDKLQEPHQLETTMYTTAVGLALANPEVARD